MPAPWVDAEEGKARLDDSSSSTLYLVMLLALKRNSIAVMDGSSG